MSDFNRRTLMKTLGAGSLTVSGISGTVAASGATVSPGESEELSTWEAYQYLLKSLEYEPVEEMRTYLRQEKRAWIDTDGLSGKKIILEDRPTHALLTVPLATTQGEEGTLFIRVFEKMAVATVYIDGSVYKANPAIVDSEVSIAGSTEDDYGVITAEAWREHAGSNDRDVSIQADCDIQYNSIDLGGGVCKILGGVAAFAGVVAYITTGPAGPVLGTVIISSGTGSGACLIGDGIDDLYEECNVSEVSICIKWNCNFIGGSCDPSVEIWAPDCS